MSSTLDLRSARRLFYGTTEVRELWRDGQRLYARPSADATVFLLAGQSNSVAQSLFDGGAGYPERAFQLNRYAVLPTGRADAFANAFDVASSRIVPATHPLHHWWKTSPGYAGWALQFAIDWCAAHPGADLVLVPAGLDDTGFRTDEWNEGDPYFEDAVARVNAVMTDNPGFGFGGILWHQGEKDAATTTSANAYQAALDAMIAAFRARIAAAAPATPFVAGNLYPGWVSGTAPREQVQAIITDLPNRLAYTATVDSAGTTSTDGVHFDAPSMRTMGSRYLAALAEAEANAGTAELLQSPYPGPAPLLDTGATMTILGRNYDEGGEGVAYHDATADHPAPTDDGGRTGTLVDHYLGDIAYISAGEWLEFTFEAASAGAADLTFSVGTSRTGKRIRADFHRPGETVPYATTGDRTIPNTGSFTTYQDMSGGTVTLEEGTQIVRVTFPDGELNYRSLTLAAAVPVDPPPPTGEAGIAHAGRAFYAGDPVTGLVLDMPLTGAAQTDGAGLVTIAAYDSSFGGVPDVANVSATPLDDTGTALGPAVAAVPASNNDNSYTRVAIYDLAMTLPAGTVALRFGLDVVSTNTGHEVAINLFDLVGLAGRARTIQNVDLTNFAGTYDFVAPYAASLFVAAAAHRRGGDWPPSPRRRSSTTTTSPATRCSPRTDRARRSA